ncbi:putative enzyme related to lactoylglutathione lyase [Cryobacterium sp. MP_3.1]|uniref:VOC family protein n=1 Tax=Cryobacterium zongtaii TaxID=1259217 RepID=UPI0010575B8F|nr:VOC family protein [Cryobacterium zongtaii]MEC5185150.1 putative enzyme related to lactoylglutathione lyase [Cryobacterium sp. MP_3.1]
MKVTSVTVGLPVRDLPAAERWYRRVFEVSTPSVEPAPGVIEFVVGPIDLQLSEEPPKRSGAQVTLRLGVPDASAEYERLTGLGVDLGTLEHVPGAVDYFDFTDPDGNALSMYSLNA